jgi:hypothetical protein
LVIDSKVRFASASILRFIPELLGHGFESFEDGRNGPQSLVDRPRPLLDPGKNVAHETLVGSVEADPALES